LNANITIYRDNNNYPSKDAEMQSTDSSKITQLAKYISDRTESNVSPGHKVVEHFLNTRGVG
jgi:hypothetical protein